MEFAGTVAMVLRRKGTEVVSVSPNATVLESLRLMAEHNIGAVLVVDDDQLVGVLSERTWARHVSAAGADPRSTHVRDVAVDQPVCVSPSDDVTDCMRVMTEQRVRHLAVIEDGQLVGMVSIGDLVNWVIFAQDSTIEQLGHYISGSYPV